ncbi:S-ribosylhomocysteine lyase [Desulfotalea psychrophila]|uniref:S-ribosylhomocysteine lyase n=1 Tax=Desulfotalea psychrophila (strain LSv54 / DSM 12343) TaxID=177439 RepID=LUXS_DESPS|nr:S-ribosylhomocysteine lyase [Desulfotalea psychrophila]Q6AQW6.1 RecName: Full=S-ribosylhomocysteine lyase; AltName: Full=AI-2 synthesis protein; AltName: Full=Autoinducer-2 production protein LuxS [Desulfotalea psychrophila LSv54]CAG35258.1 probable autoinducer-2 production protein (LuxS) [Desulfotalea psychrophila LSv54]
MEKIASFTIDHTKLKRGVYVSRQDKVAGNVITTFDLRLKEPNNEPALDGAASHTIEHIGATFLRNHKTWADRTIYFGPMGCQTGFYLILAGDWKAKDIVPLMQEMFAYVAQFTGTIPGESAVECGNFRFMDLIQAKEEAGKYFTEVLDNIAEKNLSYPS